MSALVDALCAPPSDTALVYDTFNAANFLFDAAAFCDGAGIVAAPASAHQAPVEAQAATTARARKRRRRPRSCKSREETETQRMTHIAVERNRRRQMNEYLAALRSIMPEAYVQRVRARAQQENTVSCQACSFLLFSTCSSSIRRHREESDGGATVAGNVSSPERDPPLSSFMQCNAMPPLFLGQT
jgi:hypothetical protein